MVPSMDRYATYPHSYLSLGTNPANKHNYFNEMKGWGIRNCKWI